MGPVLQRACWVNLIKFSQLTHDRRNADNIIVELWETQRLTVRCTTCNDNELRERERKTKSHTYIQSSHYHFCVQTKTIEKWDVSTTSINSLRVVCIAVAFFSAFLKCFSICLTISSISTLSSCPTIHHHQSRGSFQFFCLSLFIAEKSSFLAHTWAFCSILIYVVPIFVWSCDAYAGWDNIYECVRIEFATAISYYQCVVVYYQCATHRLDEITNKTTSAPLPEVNDNGGRGNGSRFTIRMTLFGSDGCLESSMMNGRGRLKWKKNKNTMKL